MAYEWRDNAACRATYKVFTHPVYNQLRPEAVTFEQAGARTMGSLPYFNHSASGSLRGKIARVRAQEFLLYLEQIHPLVTEKPSTTTLDAYKALGSVLSAKSKTVADFAGVVDELFKLPDEA